MQEIFNSSWTAVLIATVILAVVHIVLNKQFIKFGLPRASLPLTLLVSVLFWLALALFNQNIDWGTITTPFILGVLFALIIQSFYPKTEVYMGLLSLLAILLIYYFMKDNLIIALGCFLIGTISVLTMRLLRSEKLVSNQFSAIAVLLPLYCGLIWNNTIGLPEDTLILRNTFILILAFISLAYSFSLNLLEGNMFWIKRTLAFIIVALLTFLIFNNMIDIPTNIIILTIASFVFGQVLDILNRSDTKTPAGYALEAFAGISLILTVGFIITRLFGIWGFVIVSVCLIAFATTRSYETKLINWPAIAIFFYSIKVIVQIFIENTSLNVTGLNLTHPYVYVGLMLGLFVPMVILGAALIFDRKVIALNFLILISFGLTFPLLIAYLIHSEASGAALLAISVSAFVITIGGKIFTTIQYDKVANTISNGILPLGALIGIMLLTNPQLIEIGNLATRTERAQAFAAVSLILVILFIASIITSKHKHEEFYPEEEKC